MTKEELREYYKVINVNKVNEDITKVDLYHAEGDNNRHVRLLFAYNKLYYTGDMGTYVFGNFVYDIKTFFQGREINPGYWSEKCEAAEYPVVDTDIDGDKAREEVMKYIFNNHPELCEHDDQVMLCNYNLQSDIDDCFDDWDENEYVAFNKLDELFSLYDFIDIGEIVSGIIGRCQKYNNKYLYACEVIQWVENEVLEV